MTSDNNNRRSHERLGTRVPVTVKALAFPPETQPELFVDSVDVSGGGVRVRANEGLSVGQKLQVTVEMDRLNKFHPGLTKGLEMDTDQSLTAIAEVIRVQSSPGGGYEAGIRFLDVDEDDQTALCGLIHDSLKRRGVQGQSNNS